MMGWNALTLPWLLVAAAVLTAAVWLMVRRPVDVSCTLDLESTHDHFHAHVDLHGIEVDAGDHVTVHNAPNRIPFGTHRQMTSRATVRRASWLRRQVVKLTGGTELDELYDVGFEG